MERMSTDLREESENLQKLKKFVRLNTGNMAAVLICALFFCSAFLTPGRRQDITLWEIFLNSFLSFWASMAINNLYNNKAIINGLTSVDIVEAARTHNERIDIITEQNAIDELDIWCKEQNKKNYRNQRARILSKVGLSYSTCFTENGDFKEVDIIPPDRSQLKRLGLRMWALRRALARRQTKAYRKAVHLRLSELSAGELTGEGDNRNDPFNLGRGIAEYKKQLAATNTASKIIFALVMGYLATDLVADFSWLKLMVRAVQIVMFIAMGIVQYLNTTNYMTGEYKDRLTRKGRYLLKFLSERVTVTEPVTERSAEKTYEREVPDQLGGGDDVATAPSEGDGQLHAAAG